MLGIFLCGVVVGFFVYHIFRTFVEAVLKENLRSKKN
jgi:hypothetical protein